MKARVAKVLGCFLALMSMSSQASLIQWDAFDQNDQLAVKDETSGLIWLDLTLTAGRSYTEAGTLFKGWRHATNNEVVALFNRAFRAFTVNTAMQYQANCLAGNACYNNTSNWLSLFGAVPHALAASIKYGFGLYRDENNVLRMSGAIQHSATGRANLYGPDFQIDYTNSFVSGASYVFGSFLVKDLSKPSKPDNSVVSVSEPGKMVILITLLSWLLIRHRPGVSS